MPKTPQLLPGTDTAAVAFDLEGTCVILEDEHFEAHRRALAEYRVESTAHEISSLPGAIGGGDPYIAHRLARLHFSHLSEESIVERTATLLMRKNAHFTALIAGKDLQPRPGVIEKIQAVRELGLKLAIGSLTPRLRGMAILEQSGLLQFFPEANIVFREAVNEPKPAPDVYLETARRMGIDPSRQLVFEDSATGVNAARAAESRVVAVPVPLFQSNHAFMRSLWAAECVAMSWDDVVF